MFVSLQRIRCDSTHLLIKILLFIMKRLVFIVCAALTIGIGITSCKQKSEAPKTAQVEEQAVADPVEALQALVDKAQTEGAEWSIDQWKDAYKQALTVAKPMFQAIGEMTKAINKESSDDKKIIEMLGKMTELEKQYKPVSDLFDQFEKIAEGTENGKTVSDDKEWGLKLMDELGIDLGENEE